MGETCELPADIITFVICSLEKKKVMIIFQQGVLLHGSFVLGQ